MIHPHAPDCRRFLPTLLLTLSLLIQALGQDTSTAPGELIAESGGSDTWETFAHWRADVRALLVLKIAVAGRDKSEAEDLVDEITQSRYRIQYTPVRAVTPDSNSRFRVLSVKNRQPVDILEWPTLANNWTMTVRARPGADFASRHEIEIQIGVSNGAGAAAPKTKPIEMTRSTETADATQGTSGEESQQAQVSPSPGTQGTAQAEAGEIAQTEMTGGLASASSARAPRAAVDKKVVVAPGAGWKCSGINVETGDTVIIEPSGKWVCGAGGEEVDSRGYPVSAQFYAYYGADKDALCQIAGVPYGALLMAIGDEKKAKPVGAGLKIVAAENGVLRFDVNEKTDFGARADNRGFLTVRVRLTPGSPTP